MSEIKYKRLPIQALMKATARTLKRTQDIPVYEYIDGKCSPPYITFGDVEATPAGAKDTQIHSVSMELVVYSMAHTRREVNDILSDLHVLFTALRLGTEEDGFSVMSQDIARVTTARAETTGYAGIIEIICNIQEIKQEEA